MLPNGSRRWTNGYTTRGRALLVAGVLLLGTLAACGGGDDSDGDGDNASGGGGELVVAVGTLGTLEFAPHLYGADNLPIGKLFFDTLTRVNKDTQQIEGSLAESYSLSDDGLTWNFKLRPDIKFHDDWGTLTAEDVKYTWGEWIRDDSLQNRAPQLREAIDGDINNFEVVSDLEFNLHASKPFTALPAVLSSTANGLMVTSKKYHEEDADADTHPISTGPWKYVSSTPGVEIKFERNDDYWGEVPHYKTLVIKEIPDSAARLVQVESGEVDISSLDSRLINEAKNAGLQIFSAKDIATAQVVLGGMYPDAPNYDRDAPWIQADDPDKGLAVREALSLAINRELILDSVLLGEGTLNYCPFFSYPANEETTDPSWELPAYDVELAKEKLAEGGFEGGGFPITMFLYPDDSDTVAVGEAIAQMWTEIGVDVTLEPSEEDLLDEKLNTMETDGLAFVKQQGSDDPVMLLNNYLSSQDSDHKFHSDIIDNGYEALSAESDPDVRMEIVRQMCTDMRDEFHPLTLFTVNVPFVAGSGVDAWTPVPGDKELNSLETVTPAS